ncbi:hypothetical protein ACFQ05_39315 [Amycolatopsis umgeniensis]|uniref:Uncharacterized protein n=1 Tax=Amycolatopsis umgeniensis TaxID=336628 RepID=A0A841AYA2_9PSEU|nr:hypothetical protein [Amycolatopsis umgeniensis]MBB5851352.1 hypothetical protein [Amycolatopsis umgeniensis]
MTLPEPEPKHRRDRSGRHELVDATWFGRLERLLQSWPPTLRLALLIAVVLTGTAAIAATLGIGGQLALIALSLVERRKLRDRMARGGRTTPPGKRGRR